MDTPTLASSPAEAHQEFWEQSGDELVTFGRFRGRMYKEVPTSYLEWSIKECKSNESSSLDLQKLARWAETKLEKDIRTVPPDPEVNAKIPYVPPLEESGRGSSSSQWPMVGSQHPVEPGGRAKGTRKWDFQGERGQLSKEMPEEVANELEALRTRLACLQDEYGVRR